MMGVESDRERVLRWKRSEECQTGAETGAGMGRERERGRERGRGWKPIDQHRTKTGTETRTGSGRAEERRMNAKNRTRLVDAISPFHSARVIISADWGGACGHPTAPFARPGVYTRTSNRVGNRCEVGDETNGFRGGIRVGDRNGYRNERGRGRERGSGHGWKRGWSGNDNGGVGQPRNARRER